MKKAKYRWLAVRLGETRNRDLEALKEREDVLSELADENCRQEQVSYWHEHSLLRQCPGLKELLDSCGPENDRDAEGAWSMSEQHTALFLDAKNGKNGVSLAVAPSADIEDPETWELLEPCQGYGWYV